MQNINIAFQLSTIYLNPSQLLLSKSILKSTVYTKKYGQIKASIKEIGIIEPLIVAPTADKKEFVLLDGHIRLEILKDLGFSEIPCLLSSDDENYTYNKKINRLATIQEHFMIRRAIDQGVDEERLASALNIDIKSIRSKINLLNGICPEVIELLKDRELSPNVFSLLKKMKSVRQIECAELMTTLNNLTVPYAKALLMTTPPNMLVDSKKISKKTSNSFEAIRKIEIDSANLHIHIKLLEQNYAQDTLNSVLATGYLRKLLGNNNIKNYLEKNHTEIFSEFESILKSSSP
ncbi:plasmid partitioning protein RepB C-terminal domain-containing protein [Acinetobacter junii]|uniref:plasmid partitioning protein RepB C-terminal domain-containing protein n=1 Tax=Acinetobacter junii TaxID=40215 RepID=UPI001A58575D|nr:plasmid partitioning protein RepB C-terminal domain-containing protein [Acinetobacter junii]MBL8281519.1 ParB N-terminal domain-containing protein [Acinetobacter junii]USR72890.1 ParB N-terminal domain-containing protein [Acinetobacter junii]